MNVKIHCCGAGNLAAHTGSDPGHQSPMKNLLATALLALPATWSTAQTATNFNCADCNGVTHDLFAELDAGKVIVIDWVMPCASCIGPSLTTYNVVQSFQASHPDRVHMYLCDDFANTNCTSLNSWRNNQGLTNTTTFSNADISMYDYGDLGMPKVVVLGGPDHAVYFNAGFSVNSNDLQQAITEALSAASAVAEQGALAILPLLAPNPSDRSTWLELHPAAPTEALIQLTDLTGRPIMTLFRGVMPQGPRRVEIRTGDLPAGAYLVRAYLASQCRTLRLIVSH